MECLLSSPSWPRSVLVNDQEIKREKAAVCVYAVSVLCVGEEKEIPEAEERWKGEVERLWLYSSYQDAVCIEGEAIEFEWRTSKDFHHCISSSNPTRFGEKEHPARKLQGQDHLYVKVQRL